ncbi:hypothetical protein EDD17DRAFT_1760740 [Pisolithus thermaeus]|nr:hypothetical protein EV401DRAFT_2211976 [Pisolithus croceorrhizus]KAI6160590.1 hypothetical protein EDD17DRAFT_1760740 [Pisolithus thermaeus]
MYKRKHRKSAPYTHDQASDKLRAYPTSVDDTPFPDFDPSLYIVAHEADIVNGPRAVSAALALDIIPLALMTMTMELVVASKNLENLALHIYWWTGTTFDCYWTYYAHDHPNPSSSTSAARRPLSLSGWSDLPSDSEDTFFSSPEEADDYRRDKRRKLIDHARQERMRAILARDRERDGATEEDSDVWGGSDEEPDETQKELFRRTAVHIMSSPNPAQLEMRILANHGADKRSAFLRGGWSRAWKVAKELARQERREARESERTENPSGSSSLQGLIVGYGDSEESGDESGEGETAEDKAVNVSELQLRKFDGTSSDEADRQKARRERAREWSARRRVERFSNEGRG